MPLAVNMGELKKNIKGAKVKSVLRMKTTRDGTKKDSETVLIESEGNFVPNKVFLGFMSYPVRVYVPKPLRCFKCQRYGHTAKVCKEQRRCARCGGDHEYGKCGDGVQPRCCNCGGAHSVAYGGCEFMKRENEIQKVRVERKLSYAEAARVTSEKREEGAGSRVPQKKANHELYVDKNALEH